jgi:DNA polymerase type B, organellar and viral
LQTDEWISLPRKSRKLAWNSKEFIGWDGEGIQHEKPSNVPEDFMRNWLNTYQEVNGELPELPPYMRPFDLEPAEPQPYVLLANSKGDNIQNKEGISTFTALEFILSCKKEYPNSIFVGFAFNYDIAQILKDLPWESLKEIYKTNRAKYGHYNLEWRPRRWLRVSDRVEKKSATIYDVFGFFQTSFLIACEKYLGKDDPALTLIKKGKEARDTFKWEELDDFIIPYCNTELSMLVRVMDKLREHFHEVGLDLTKWYGPGAVANQVLKKYNIAIHMSKDVPAEVTNASQYAYAGGRFEQFKLGCHTDTVYEYDIRSAYPAAIAQLPSLSNGTWEYVDTFEHDSFGVWNIGYDTTYKGDNQPKPLFCRSENGSVSFPSEVTGWYWTPEASLVPSFIRGGYIFRSTSSRRPFDFTRQLFNLRRHYVELGIPSQLALKLALNSIYGKLAQTIGGTDGPPAWHQLEWAGWITSYTRAVIYKAILLNPDAIIASETDAVFSTTPLDLDLGPGLGEWELTTFDNITYLQSGFYYATQDKKVICKYRGLDRDRNTGQPVGLPYRSVLDHLRYSRTQEHWRTEPLSSSTTRFVNIGLALQTSSIFRSWETKDKRIFVDQRPGKSKRYHMNCIKCQQGFNLADCLHPMEIGGYSGPSHRHPLPWLLDNLDEEYEYYLQQENMDIWQ